MYSRKRVALNLILLPILLPAVTLAHMAEKIWEVLQDIPPAIKYVLTGRQ